MTLFDHKVRHGTDDNNGFKSPNNTKETLKIPKIIVSDPQQIQSCIWKRSNKITPEAIKAGRIKLGVHRQDILTLINYRFTYIILAFSIK